MKRLLLAASLALLPLAANAGAKKDAYKVDPSASTVKWEGRKIGGAHQGELKIKGGELVVEKGALIGGDVEIDMTSLKNIDQTDAEMNAKLVNHLKSDDFFSVAKFPVSTLKITKVEPKGAQSIVTGDLTIKGITKPVSFPAEVKVEKHKVNAKGTITVDRTKYDIRFRSVKFFSDLGDKVIKDEFTVTVDLTAGK